MAEIEMRQMGNPCKLVFAVLGVDSPQAAGMEFESRTGISTATVYKDKGTLKEYWVDEVKIYPATRGSNFMNWRVVVYLTEVSAPGELSQPPFPDE